MKFQDRTAFSRFHEFGRARDLPGIVIRDDRGAGSPDPAPPRVTAFVYGERWPSAPALPFGRRKATS